MRQEWKQALVRTIKARRCNVAKDVDRSLRRHA